MLTRPPAYAQCRPVGDTMYPACGGVGGSGSSIPATQNQQTPGQSQQIQQGGVNPGQQFSQAAAGQQSAQQATQQNTQQSSDGCAMYSGDKSWSDSSGTASSTRYNFNGNQNSCGCITNDGWQTSPADGLYAAGVTQSLYQDADTWCGPNCGQCYELTNLNSVANIEGSTKTGSCEGKQGQTITVMLLDLCPQEGNQQWCAQPTNQYGFGVHFDVLNGPWGEFFSFACVGITFLGLWG